MNRLSSLSEPRAAGLSSGRPEWQPGLGSRSMNLFVRINSLISKKE